MTTVKIAPGAVVYSKCDLQGDITIGSHTIVHPGARIIAKGGPIVIGDCNIIEERVTILNEERGEGQHVMTIGSNNVFEVDAHIEAMKIGDYNVIEPKAHLGYGIELTNGCIISAMNRLTGKETLPEKTVVYGSSGARRLHTEKFTSQALQLDFLRKMFPNYHTILRPNKKPESAPSAKSESLASPAVL
ncbi:unnamed protein product [Darwinula stevensoni]|uniref:Dynactin subunit 6 n=1 Tax=Darwinula stevensoni TaxID=69355 RepID=A0A7R8XI64_9CRUS|nr:unnamed protein product [Darwinula stevensoni]CAG0893171.1 unnamed protein product [Darwinula stevensoni]